MFAPLSAPSLRRAGLVALIAASGGLAVPGPAAAKTFQASITDPAGDADDGSQDIVSTRVAYNRRTGAISVTLTTSEPIDPSDHDAGFAVALSNLEGGKCKKAVLVIAGVFSTPKFVIGQTVSGGVMGKVRLGKGELDDTTFSMRVRHRSLAGKTVGCAVAAVTTVETDENVRPTILDQTKGDDGFL